MQMDFVRQFPVPEWEKYIWHYPDIAYDDQKKLIYVTNGWKKEVAAYDPNGVAQPAANPQPGQQLDNPSAIALVTANNRRQALIVNTTNPRIIRFDLAGEAAQQ